jgi:hypothetical protein
MNGPGQPRHPGILIGDCIPQQTPVNHANFLRFIPVEPSSHFQVPKKPFGDKGIEARLSS